MNTAKIESAIKTQQHEAGLKAYVTAWTEADGNLGSSEEWESVESFRDWYAKWCNEQGFFSDVHQIER